MLTALTEGLSPICERTGFKSQAPDDLQMDRPRPFLQLRATSAADRDGGRCTRASYAASIVGCALPWIHQL